VCVCVCAFLCLTNCTEHQNVIRLDCMLKVQRHLQIPFSHSFRVLFENEWYGVGGGRDGEQDCLIKRGGFEMFLLHTRFGHNFKGFCYEILKTFLNYRKDIYLQSSSSSP